MAPQHAVANSGALPSTPELAEASPVSEAVCEDGEDTIQVYVRVRPFSKREQTQAGSEPPVVMVEQDQRSLVMQAAPPRRFRFDGVRSEDVSQQDMFELVGRGIADGFLDGFSGTVCVYGQTGAGKTYTMVGPVASVQQMQSDPRRGLICRTMDYVFTEVAKRRAAAAPDTAYTLRCSFLEIYREQITDLLDACNTALQLREDNVRGVHVERLSEPVVTCREEAFEVLLRGLQQRRTGATQMNERSSRSHAVFTITIEMSQVRDRITSRQMVRLNLVDLAGSERQMGVADCLRNNTLPGQGLPVKEAGAINRSLSALTNVIMALSHEEKIRRKTSGSSRGFTCRRNYVNYRDSKLTFLLRDSLGGNSRTAIVTNISPSALCSSETLSSLKFAARAKHIQCSAVRREEFAASVEDLLREVATLRRRVTELEGGQDSSAAGSTGSSCSRSSCRSSCSTEEDTMVASMKNHAAEEVELQARLSETKRDLFKAISQLAQVEAKLQLATAEANDLTQEAAKLQAVRRIPNGVQTGSVKQLRHTASVKSMQPRKQPSSTASLPCVPVMSEAFVAGFHADGSPRAVGSQQLSFVPLPVMSAGGFGREPMASPASPQGASSQEGSPRMAWQARVSPRLMLHSPRGAAHSPVRSHMSPQSVRAHSPVMSSRASTPKSTAQWSQAGTVNAFGMPSARSHVQIWTQITTCSSAREVGLTPKAAA